MDSGQVLLGSALGAYGVTFYGFARWYVRDDERLRRMARSRWGWDRRTMRKLRTGEMSQEESFERFAARQRWIVRWAFTPFIALWLGLCIFTVIHGLLVG